MVWALVLVPIVATLAVPAVGRSRRGIAIVCLLGIGLVLAVSIWAAATEAAADWRWGPNLMLHLEVSGFGRVMTVLVPAIAAPIVAYAYVTEREGRNRLVAMLIAFVGAMELLVTAADFLTLLVGWELVGGFSWVLIGHEWRVVDNVKSAAHAFITTRFGDLGLYIAAGATFAATGTFSFDRLPRVEGGYLTVIAFGVLLAAAAKSAQVPFSPWLFSAMAGPTPVSALLHSATMVAAGAYILIRLAPALHEEMWWEPAVAAIGLTTAVGGGLVALAQTQAKRVLAGSTSAQYGLMFVAVGAGAGAAAGAQLVTHATFKALLFLGAGIAIHALGSADIASMRLGRLLPRAAVLSAVGALSLAGVPPLGGAWTKEEIAAAAVHASAWLGAGVFIAGFLSALYAFRYQLLVFGPDDGRLRTGIYRPGGVELGAVGVLAAGSLGLSILWLPPAGEVFVRIAGGAFVESGAWGLAWSLAIVAAAAIVVAALHKTGDLVSMRLPTAARDTAANWFGLAASARVLVADPLLALARFLAEIDDRVIDAGVRGAATLARMSSRLLALRAEDIVDGIVRGLAALTLIAGRDARVADEQAVDGVVEGVAQGVGELGERSRRLQTGLSHHYYVVVACGLALAVGVLAFAR